MLDVVDRTWAEKVARSRVPCLLEQFAATPPGAATNMDESFLEQAEAIGNKDRMGDFLTLCTLFTARTP